MCSNKAPAFLHRFIYMLQIFGVIYFNKYLNTSWLKKTYFILRTLCQWIILAFSTYTFYEVYFSHSLIAEDVAVIALWVATIIHFQITTVVLLQKQKMIIHMLSEMYKIIEHCTEKLDFQLCRFIELLISTVGAAMLSFAFVVSIVSRETTIATQIVYANNILTNYISILVEEIILIYIFFVNTVIRTIQKDMTMANLRADDVKRFRGIYRDLCILTVYVNYNFGIILTSCVSFSQVQCWVDMLMFIRTSYESQVIDIGGILFIIATFYHILFTYLLCWICEDIENQVINRTNNFLFNKNVIIVLQESKIKTQIHYIEDDCDNALQDQVRTKIEE